MIDEPLPKCVSSILYPVLAYLFNKYPYNSIGFCVAWIFFSALAPPVVDWRYIAAGLSKEVQANSTCEKFSHGCNLSQIIIPLVGGNLK